MDSAELIEALNSIEKEKGIDKEIIFEAIENSLISACKKNFGTSQNIKVDINRETGDVKVYAQKEIVEDVYDAFLEISLEDAREIDPAYEYGDIVDIEVTPKNFGRISAQTAKQVVVQKFREAEREKLFNEYITKEREIDTGIVQRVEGKRNVIVSLGKLDAVLPYNEQISTDEYKFDDRLKVYILEVKQTTKGPQVTVSRTHYELVKRLFELEVPEIFDGTVEIKNISREAGSRTKMAVYSQNPNVDAVGACVGPNGSRVNVIVNELNGEKIDIINWSEDIKQFISEALNPSEVIAVEINKTESEQSARVVVPDNQLSLAIGKEGQNVRLAARLTGWKIDIKSESQAKLTNFVDFSNSDIFINKKDISNETEFDEE
ncbi:MAG: transcription termination/antitermination protein NusA [Clostridiales bacterium]|nr:transcription termination/antitermination protein NusA [Clostridiales bacterium]